MLEKPEEKEFHKKWESLYVFTGRRSDLTTMISIAVINPMILYVFIGYVAGKLISLPVLYLIIDGVLFLQWGLLVKRRKRKIEQSIQDVAGQMDTIREKINELGTTVLIVTHEKELVNQFSKRVVAIDGGHIISDGMDGYYNYE